MQSIFRPESAFFRVLDKIGNLILVSLFWLLGCLPVVTIGASTIALYYTTVKAVRCGESYVTREFWSCYRKNLKTGILATLLFFLLALVIGLDYYYTESLFAEAAGVMQLLYLLLAATAASLALYLFPVLSRFTMGSFGCFKLALFMVFKHLPTTAALLLITAAGIVGALLIPVPLLFIVPGVCCWLMSFLMERALRRYMAKPQTEEEAAKWYYHG